MIVLLDTSTLLAACWSTKGLSHALIECGRKEGWSLITADYCVAEVEKNVGKYPDGPARWRRAIRSHLEIVGSIYVIDRPVVFEATKDRPVLLSAIGANADYLVTSDKADFGHVLGTVVYGRARRIQEFALNIDRKSFRLEVESKHGRVPDCASNVGYL